MADGGSDGNGHGNGWRTPDDAEAKKNLKTLTRTDFLLQFVWQPPKPEEQPKTDEERDAKIKEIVEKMTEAQKNNPAVTMPKVEDLQAASLKKTEELDSKIQNALTPAAPGGAGGAPAERPVSALHRRAPELRPGVLAPPRPRGRHLRHNDVITCSCGHQFHGE